MLKKKYVRAQVDILAFLVLSNKQTKTHSIYRDICDIMTFEKLKPEKHFRVILLNKWLNRLIGVI